MDSPPENDSRGVFVIYRPFSRGFTGVFPQFEANEATREANQANLG